MGAASPGLGDNEAVKVNDAIALGQRLLPQTPGIPDPRREARWLLAHAWGVEEAWLVSNPGGSVPAPVLARYRAWIERRARGEPAHHLTGTCTFWGRRFAVSAAVLIPRPETELLIEAALSLDLPSTARVLDAGTGSGCLAVTLALEWPSWEVVAVDISCEAARVASRNAATLGACVRVVCGDLSAALAPGFGLVAANLPYIPTNMLGTLPVEVQHDPRRALDGGHDGLTLVRRLINDLPRILAPGGWALLELGEEQSSEAVRLAGQAGLVAVRTVRDLGGCERILLLRKPGGVEPVTGREA